MDCEGSAKLIHARLIAGFVMARDSREPPKSLKALAENRRLDGAAVSVRKEILASVLLLRGRIDILPQPLVQVGTDRDAPHSIEPLAADRNQITFQVNVLTSQPQRLPGECAGSIEKEQQYAQGLWPDLAGIPFLTEPCSLQ